MELFSSEAIYTLTLNKQGNDFWKLAIDYYCEKDKRNEESIWVMTHKKGGDTSKWKIGSDDGGITYKISIAGGPFQGYELVAHHDVDKDKRDNLSIYARINKPGASGNRWRITECQNGYVIKNASTQRFLMAHRFWPNDTRDNDSTYVMTYQHEDGFYWRIIKET